MDTSEFGTEKVKEEVDNNDFNEDFQTDTVKHEPCKINIVIKCEMYDEGSSETDLVDKPHYVDHSDIFEDISTNECTEQIKNEEDVDIKQEIVEETFFELYRFCKVCNNSFSSETGFIDSRNRFECSCQEQNDSINLQSKEKTSDVKLASLGLASGSGLQQFIAQNKTASEDECSNKQVSSSAPQRESVTPFENTKKLTASSITDDILLSKHQMCNAQNSKNNEKSHTGEKPFQCKICSKSFIYPKSLNGHIKMHTEENLFQCKICSKTFTSKNNLKGHLKIHTGEKPFQCKICFKSFICKSNMKVHSKSHTGEKPFHCKMCSKCFGTLQYLNIHERVHTGERPFQCKICSKAFISKTYFNIHLNIHTEEKTFQCKICLKIFSTLQNMKVHKRIHTGERAFHCQICSKSFITKTHLNRHSKVHSEEKLFDCRVCSKSFKSKENLNYHSKIHTRKKLFQCSICSKSFARNSNLNVHHLKVHAGERPFH